MNKDLMLMQNEITMTTVEIAELTGKQHKHVKRDTKRMLLELYGKDVSIYGHIYKDKYNREQKCYRLPKIDAERLIQKYKLRSKNKKSKFVYIFKCKVAYKIGIAVSINNRLMNVQTGNPFKVYCIYSAKIKRARTIEAILHNRFRNKRMEGEWFNLNKKELKIAKCIIKENAY